MCPSLFILVLRVSVIKGLTFNHKRFSDIFGKGFVCVCGCVRHLYECIDVGQTLILVFVCVCV